LIPGFIDIYIGISLGLIVKKRFHSIEISDRIRPYLIDQNSVLVPPLRSGFPWGQGVSLVWIGLTYLLLLVKY
jgi:hypothetical protein